MKSNERYIVNVPFSAHGRSFHQGEVYEGGGEALEALVKHKFVRLKKFIDPNAARADLPQPLKALGIVDKEQEVAETTVKRVARKADAKEEKPAPVKAPR